eukprot:CAMPEP_0177678362 /NCGR_PEP_ID=MMETSP0447-20121125/28969_1 /TAXON_ID=0 /ORGANISM="Stygamoeba regulata, Strain BSH-02190019" /LENGTH=510 /DNA_ID=CAMNT_0019187361 /DNA_START=131 /DNA_END=1663 /DNA_ORIENTATION=-
MAYEERQREALAKYEKALDKLSIKESELAALGKEINQYTVDIEAKRQLLQDIADAKASMQLLISELTPYVDLSPSESSTDPAARKGEYDMHGLIVRGSLWNLIEVLTDEKYCTQVDKSFRQTFFLTYHLHSPPHTVYETLIKRWRSRDFTQHASLAKGLKKELERQAHLTHKCIVDLFLYWTDFFIQDWQLEAALVSKLIEFMNTVLIPQGWKKEVEELRKNLISCLGSLALLPSQKMVIGSSAKISRSKIPSPLLPESEEKKASLETLSLVELARQLALHFHSLLCKVTLPELYSATWKSPKEAAKMAPNIHRFLDFSERFTSFCTRRILKEEDTEKRARLIEGTILLASHSVESHNVAGAAAILKSLVNPMVRRLDQTWTEVDPKIQQRFQDLALRQNSADDGMMGMDMELKSSCTSSPGVPNLEVILRHIDTILSEERSNSTETHENLLLSCTLLRKLSSQAVLVYVHQRNFYRLHSVPTIQAQLSSLKAVPLDQLQELSLRCQPPF